MKTILILVFGTFVIIIFSCKTEEIILHGEIKGLVTDASTSQPLQAATVKLNPVNEIPSTGSAVNTCLKALHREIMKSRLQDSPILNTQRLLM
jgi:hypothetical protein